MLDYQPRDILIYLAVKYDGDVVKIINALSLKEDLDIAPNEMKRVCQSVKSKVMTFLDYDYPEVLKRMNRPPIVLFYYGDITLLYDNTRKYAVVGTREPSKYGIKATQKIVSEMARGNVLVSGMAKGIDAIGHQAAIDNHGRTIAILGSGIDYCYPEENRELYERLKKDQLVISEYPGMVLPDGPHFPMRNRLVVQLSEAIVVPEVKTHRSGSIISINIANSNDKPVYIVPHPIFNDCINNFIINEGANVAENGKDILEDLKWL